MANKKIRSSDFLPSVFRSDANKKFLGATLDQLISQPDFKKINGFVGRKFAPTYQSTDNYVTEPNENRQNYQLEPSLTLKNANGLQEFSGNYVDYLQQIAYYGGNTTNHNRLFSNEYYSFNGLFDFDKFVNFSQYYWVPNGLDPVYVSAGNNVNEFTYTVTRNQETGGYQFTNHSNNNNPLLILNRGGTYKFQINQPGIPFWIQSEVGTSGVKDDMPTVSTREILGVTNNGIDVGTITVQVPLSTAQDFYTSMPFGASVDIACPLSFNQIANKKLSTIIDLFGGIDGTVSNLNGKTIIFVSPDYQDYFWTVESGTTPYGNTIPKNFRYGTWTINLIDDGNGDFDISLLHNIDILISQRVEIRYGTQYSNRQFYKDGYGFYKAVPSITASLDYLYYQDNNSATMTGIIKLADPVNSIIDVEYDIIGREHYTSANGVSFTNGLHVDFDDTVKPAQYRNKTYYVEGVGKQIRLIEASKLVTPEQNIDNTAPDYITINRASNDKNAWSRSNRWFHIDVITDTASYNNVELNLTNFVKGTRAIIEFDPDIQLFNEGKVSYDVIDVLNFDIIDPFESIVGQQSYSVNGVNLEAGMKVIFANANDPLVKDYLHTVVFENVSGVNKINLVNSGIGVIETGHTVVATNGSTIGTQYHYTGEQWIKSQQKTSKNQYPLFDVFDDNELSFSDSIYVDSSFVGTKIFSYKEGSGNNDTILGFPLSYRTMQSVGDIEFYNDFDNQTFAYTVDKLTATLKVNTGRLVQNHSLTNKSYRNIWTKSKYPTRQYQIISHVFDNVTNYFEIDILPEYTSDVPTLKVYVGGKIVSADNYQIKTVGSRTAVVINPSLLTTSVTVDIAIFNSTKVSKLGYYEIPQNIGVNAQNRNFETLTLGQMRNHLMTVSTNSFGVIGDMPGRNNIRDLNVKQQGGSIIQHAAPAIYGQLFLTHQQMNFMNGLNLARREYTRFKNRFIELSTTLDGVDINNIPYTTDLIIKKINEVKTSDSPWFYSDMVPWGDNKVELPVYTIVNTRDRQYQISEIFNDSKLSNKSVLVYVNGTLLTKDVDYSFSTIRPTVIINDSFTLNYGDKLQIVEYVSTDGNYIPETPTKLGLYPKFVPTKFIDKTYVEPVTMIRGHDGSMTPSFNDFRDDLLLELENRIYNNIKVDYQSSLIDIYDYIPGRFRTADYSLAEFNKIITRSFLSWVGSNKIDYISNTYFKSNNPWTWNFKKFVDTISGEQLPGSWRAVYNYYYDTDRPNTHPWEMLGFSVKPDWWEDRYGVAPYTGGNRLLWEDLSKGYIHAGDRQGYDLKFARYGLMQVIPVDDAGNLISPESFVKEFSSQYASVDFAIGDFGPVETAWRKSSEFPYALQQALAVMQPAMYFGTLMNVESYYRDASLDQLVQEVNAQRITQETIKVNGLTVNGTVQRTVGYINWITEYLKSLGITTATNTVRDTLDGIQIQLAYKVAGFTDKNYLEIFAEQSSPESVNNGILVPSENYSIRLYKSTPVDKVTYSAVIVERGSSGYTVSGYNLDNPYFTVIPSIVNSNSYSITSGTSTSTVYNDFKKVKVTIPYGHEFKTKQQVVDFLVSYQRFMNSQGFIFNVYNENIQSQQDWVLSAKEFLMWADQGWKQGNVLVLSPVNDEINFYSADAVVDEITNRPESSKVRGTAFDIIKVNNFSVIRDDNYFKLKSNIGQTIAYAEFNLVQYEHTITFDNITVFNDVIYQPELGSRQFRIKLIGNKTGNWTGALNPSGFIYNSENIQQWQAGKDYKKGTLVSYKSFYWTSLFDITASDTFSPSQWQQTPSDKILTGLLPNFAYNAQKFENFYDIDSAPQDKKFDFYSNGIIGFRPRQYLTDIGVDIQTQTKFYQGYIKDKGTLSSIQSLTSTEFNNISSDISINEEWAFRVGEYGALDTNNYVEVPLNEGVATSNPITVQLLNKNDTQDIGAIGFREQDLYRSADKFTKTIFKNRTSDTSVTNDIKTAGYVHREDVDAAIFDIRNYNDLNAVTPNIGSGYYIWVAKDFNNDWNVYRVSESNNFVTDITYSLDNFVQITTLIPHELMTGDIFAFKGMGAPYDGFYRVYSVKDNNNIIVYSLTVSTVLQPLVSYTGQAVLYKLNSARTSNPSELQNMIPLNGWKDNDTVWADNDGFGWEVYKKSSPWNFVDSMDASGSVYIENGQFGHSVAVSSSGTFALAGAPHVGNGVARLYIRPNDMFSDYGSLQYLRTDVKEYGHAIVATKSSAFITAPGSNNNTGYAYVYLLISGATDRVAKSLIQQIICPSDLTSGARFGESIAVSTDDRWLFISAPGAAKVYAYGLHYVEDNNDNIDAVTGTTSYQLSFAPFSSSSIIVSGSSKVYIPEIDYTVTDDTITFLIPPINGALDIIQAPYYAYVDTIDIGKVPSDEFGYFIHSNSNGAVLVVGAPSEDDKGTAYVFQRSYEKFIANGAINSFKTKDDIKDIYSVYINGIEKRIGTDFTRSGNTITFKYSLPRGAIIVIETNYMSLMQTIDFPDTLSYSNFGRQLEMSQDGNTLVISAPTYAETSYHSGLVYVYSDQQSLNGYVVGNIENPTVVNGDSIRINGFEVIFNGTTLTDCINNINTAQIPGIVASNSNNRIKIASNSVDTTNKLEVHASVGTALFDLGIEMFVRTQTIRHPYSGQTDHFGTTLKLDETANTLLVSNENASMRSITVLDGDQTTFDNGTTSYLDTTYNSGTVLVYNLVGNQSVKQYVFSQELYTDENMSGMRFGESLDIKGKYILVGTPGDPKFGINKAGDIYLYENQTGKEGWSLHRQETAKVDIATLVRSFVFDSSTENITASLDSVDPVKGKILGAADQDIDYRTEYDPAIYNFATRTNVTNNKNYYWADKYIGKTWWKLSDVRYLDYEQGDLVYRTQNWGKMFDGSTITVLEWVSSSVAPSEYVTEYPTGGTPLYEDDSAYVMNVIVDQVTGLTKTTYYFWVKDKNSIGDPTKTNSIVNLQSMIADPMSQNIPYIAAIREDAFNVYGVNQLLSDSTTILHVDYQTIDSTNLIHAEYELISENATNLPGRIVDKMIDSFAGIDRLGNVVPDPFLLAADKIGISIRPRQSVVVDRNKAIRTVVNFVNSVFESVPLIEEYDITALNDTEPMPTTGWDIKVNNEIELNYIDITNVVSGYTVLVEMDSTINGWALYALTDTNNWSLVRVQSYSTNAYWDYVTWVDSSYDITAKPTYTVEMYYDVYKLTLKTNDTVRVNNNGQNRFTIYVTEADGSLRMVALEHGTIQLKSSLYDLNSNLIGFDNSNFDTVGFDFNNGIEVRKIFEALRDSILVKNLKPEASKLFFTMMNYILSEQKSIDWAFKTSFINVVHKLRKLVQNPIYIQDNQTYFEQYIDEVKPYRTTVREYRIGYQGDEISSNNVTDFDLPPYYDSRTGTFRSPSGEISTDASVIANTPEYKYWLNNHTYSISEIIVENGGQNYSIPPIIKISGGNGTGAIATAVIDPDSETVVSVTLNDAGKEFTSIPKAEVIGNGTGAKLYVKLKKTPVRTFNGKIKFDRVSYDSSVIQWAPNIVIAEGDIVAYNFTPYRSLETADTGTEFDISKFSEMSASELPTANDRIMVYYNPNSNMPARDLRMLIKGIEYPGVSILGQDFTENESDIDSNIRSDFADIALGTRPEDILIDGGQFIDTYSSHAPEELVPGSVYDSITIKVFTKVDNGATTVGFRMFTDMAGNRSYYRISGQDTTQLASDLLITDTTIHVVDASVLPVPNPETGKPGVIFIGNEKITYYTLDLDNNTLGQIRRGVDGTSMNALFTAGTDVVDGSEKQVIFDADKQTWLNKGTTTIADGTGFDGSESRQVRFLKDRPV